MHKFQYVHLIGLGAFTLLSAVFIGVGTAADRWNEFTPTVGFSRHKTERLPLPHMRTLQSFAPFPFVFVVTILAALYHLVSLMMLRSERLTSKYYIFDQQCNQLRWMDHSIALMLHNIFLAM